MKFRRTPLALITATVVLATATVGATVALAEVPAPTQGTLQKYNINSTYVSGLSSGGFMANQLHVAYSDVFKGAGIFAAGPYDCAQNNLSTALYACMDTFMQRKTPAQLAQLTRDRAAAGQLDPVANLSGDPVWLFHGSNDRSVTRPVNDDLATYYQNLGSNVVYNKGTAAGHAWVSPIGPNACSETASPYINNCGGDPVREMLSHLMGTVNTPNSSTLTGKLVQFDQSAYVPGGSPSAISMGNEGFAYLPQTCQSGTACTLMVALHGCYQYYGLVGNALMDKAYLNEYADTNNMIVLYPQATTMAGNPRGCWDWWGYQSPQYPVKNGPQMRAVINMVAALGGTEPGTGPSPTSPATTPPAPNPTTPTADCFTSSNYAHTVTGRAYTRSGATYALGSNQPLGLWNTFTQSTLKQTSPAHWVKC
jgi:poly(3-hydroxybutyrate) depolymerase